MMVALLSALLASAVQASFAEVGLPPVTENGPTRLAGTDIIRILPPASEPVAPELPPEPKLPPALPPGPSVTPTPLPESRPGGISGRFVTLQVRLSSLPNDKIGAKLDALDMPLAKSVGLMSASGALVTETTPGGPAVLGELRVGDIAVSFNGGPIANVNEFRQRLSQTASGTLATLEVWRFLTEERDFLATLRKLADDGNADVMHRLGSMYANGNGVPRDDFEAVRWHRKAMNAGNVASTVGLAYLTLEGRGTDKNPQGNTEAMWRLGNFLLEGKAVAKDAAQAAQMFQKAAEAGHSPSMIDLGLMHNNANGLPQNYAEAARWYKRAADLNNPLGMVNLGVLHQQGRGVNQSDTTAADLYRKASDLGHPAGIHNLALIVDKGVGVARKDPERAAELIMRALSMRFEFSYKQMMENSKIWSPEFRRAMQRRLKDEGVYSGPIDGEFRQPTTEAITAMYNRTKR